MNADLNQIVSLNPITHEAKAYLIGGAAAASLATGNGPLHGTTNVTDSGGVATFTDLADGRVHA
jgi:hypothetical protein